jgi:thiol-disulfide isomerase/thioredoxin
MTICLIGVIVILAGVVFYLMMKQPEEGYKGEMKDPVANPDATAAAHPGAGTSTAVPPPRDASNVPCLALFHADWCPHCKDLLPAWEDVKKAVAGRHLIVDIESKNPIMAHHKLPGFPTIRYFPEGIAANSKFLEYKGDRSTKSILDFLSSCMSQAK